jgi:hypothetical protein
LSLQTIHMGHVVRDALRAIAKLEYAVLRISGESAL